MSEEDGTPSAGTAPARPAPSRRELLTGLVAGTLGAGVGVLAGRRGAPDGAADESGGPGRSGPAGTGLPTTASDASAHGGRVAVHGTHQAGVVRPDTPQTFGLLTVADLPEDQHSRPVLRELLARLGETIAALIDHPPSESMPDGAGDLTVTVGLGPRLVAALDPTWPGAEGLPPFAGDEGIPASRRGGDLLIAAYATDPGVLTPAADAALAVLPGATPRWSQRVFRGPGRGTRVRNPLGFHDGVIVPRGEEELAENVWIDGPGPEGGTVCVLRRLRLDLRAFAALGTPAQERVIGRRHADGSPLSGGGPDDQVDLIAKDARGEFLVPLHSHARAAHPSFTGSDLMLRRSYAFDDGTLPDGTPDAGLLFVSFQRTLRTFVATQHRLDETDDLMRFATPTASAAFLVLPGFDDRTPLGAARGH